MTSSNAAYLLQMHEDVRNLMGHGPRALCRTQAHGGYAYTGARAADLNMAFLTRGATRSELDEAFAAARDLGVDAILLVEQGADDLRAWASGAGLAEVGQLPVMERPAAAFDHDARITVRRAAPADMQIGNRLAASAFSLEESQCNLAVPEAALAVDGNELWIAEEAGEPVGCGVFIRSGDHVGIYMMSTPAAHQRKGIGGTVLAAAMAHHQASGATRFTLGATEKGYPLYERVGFRLVSQPHIFVIGASTQFP